MYNINSATTNRGGAGILVHKSIQHRLLQVENDFDTIGIEIISKLKCNIYSSYIPPNQNFNILNLERVFQNYHCHSLITGDFNARHNDWGSPINNSKGNTLSKFINQNNLILLNDGSPTHFSTHNTFTHLDITISTSALKIHCDWTILNDLYGSDHFPIKTTLFPLTNPEIEHFRPKFLIKKADWTKFEFKSQIYNLEQNYSVNINKESANIKRIILKSANDSIPTFKPNRIHKTVPWWNQNLESLKKIKNRLWNEFNKNINLLNLINYKKANSKLKREIKLAKREAIVAFTSEINPFSPISKIWGNIRKFSGYKATYGIHSIEASNNPLTFITGNKQIADKFCNHWSSLASDTNFPQIFQNHKNTFQKPQNLAITAKNLEIEKDITYIEFSSAINKLKGHTPGVDRISYPMIRNLSRSTKDRIIKHFNSILNNFIPQNYKASLIIPIQKPNSDKTQISSYRPISLNPCLSKLLDKIVSNRLWWFMLSENLICKQQIGFKKGKAVTENLLFIDFHISKCLSSKSHLSLLSLDFEKAFDKIGLHTIIDQLIAWKIGPKIINYIINFMSNRKITVRIRNILSDTLPLDNGIPQGSPLSVVLFLIAYNKLSSIISLHRELKFCAYADDFIILIKCKEKNPTTILNELYNDISNWCDYSGAKLSTSKCKYIHFCRKHNCKSTIVFNNSQVEEVDNLRILGLIFNNKYYWNSHIEYLANNLKARNNIIKCLGTPKYNCSTHTLIYVLKALIISKLSYGLQIYGHAPKTTLAKVKTTLNTSVRIALGAYRTTNTNNLLFEARILTIEEQVDYITAKSFKSCITSKDTQLKDIIKHITKKTKPQNIVSSLERTIKFCKNHDIPYLPDNLNTKHTPSWTLKTHTINTSLNKNTKNNTPSDTYTKLFAEIQSKLTNYNFIYTDGSKLNNHTAYSIIEQNKITEIANLPHYSSVFSSEIIAIYRSIEIVKNKPGKFAICSDSLSALNSIKNIKNSDFYSSIIRSNLTTFYPKIKLIWIPGHVNIKGNVQADEAAKFATKAPLETVRNYNKSDINKYLKNTFSTKTSNNWNFTSTWYKTINPFKTDGYSYLHYNNSNITRLDEIKFIKIRLGHTKLTHEHLMSGNSITYCIFCNTGFQATLHHILIECDHFKNTIRYIFKTDNPIDLLKTPSDNVISLFIKFLKITNLYHNI
mgnify:CR=1 FL=1